MKNNHVAKNMHKTSRAVTMRDRTKYKRNDKRRKRDTNNRTYTPGG